MKNKNLLILLAISLILGLFYWFQIRPANIKSVCVTIAKDEAHQKLQQEADKPGGWGELEDMASSGGYRRGDYEFYYDQCLREKGL